MAAPTQSQSPTTAGQQRPPAIYSPPRSPDEVAREQKRVNLLLEINSHILQHISQLQTDGQGGMVTVPPQGSDQANPPKMASQEYILCLRCMQANFTWLAASASGAAGNARTLPGPALMDSPIENPSLAQKYEELKRLFPNWRGTVNARPPASQQHGQGQGQVQGPPHTQSQLQMQQSHAGQQPPGSGQGMPPG